MVDDLCRHTLTADEERLSSRPYLYTAAAVLMTMADLFHNVWVTMAATLLILAALMVWLYELRRPVVRITAPGSFSF